MKQIRFYGTIYFKLLYDFVSRNYYRLRSFYMVIKKRLKVNKKVVED